MASRYWVGGTAAWDGTAGTKWALTSGGAGGQAVPTSADDVFFDAASGAVTVTVGATGNCNTLTFTGFTGTFTGSNNIVSVGNVTLVAGMTFSFTGSLQMTGSGTLTSAGKSFTGGGVTLGSAGTVNNLGDALNTSFNLVINGGTFNSNNYNITTASLSSSNAVTRTINLGSSTVTISGSATSVNFSNQTGLTFNAGTSTINASSSLSIGTGVTFNNVSFTGSGSNISLSITGTNTFNQLSFTAPASAGVTKCSFSASQTITTMVCSGTSAVNRIFLRADAGVSSVTLNATTWTTVSDVDFQRITLTNAKSPTRGGDCGGNTNITFPAAKTVYWNLAGAQNWSATGWATSSGGSPAVNNFPLAQDTAVFDKIGRAHV